MKGQSHLLETLLRDVFSTASAPVFEALLTLLASTLEREVEDAKGLLIPALRALSVVSALSIQRKYEFRHTPFHFSLQLLDAPPIETGRIYRTVLARILNGLRRLMQRSQNAQVHLGCLRLAEVIASEKVSISFESQRPTS